MDEIKKEKAPYFYACCPNCKAVLIQAKNGLEGYTKCSKCGEYIHIVIRNDTVTTKIKVTSQ